MNCGTHFDPIDRSYHIEYDWTFADLYDQYRKVRGTVAIPKKDLLKINASSSNQQCKKFGLHPALPALKKLYEDGDALFLAGVGVLTKFVTKDNYMSETQTQLFAHNTCKSWRDCIHVYNNYMPTNLFVSNNISHNSTRRDKSAGPLSRNERNWIHGKVDGCAPWKRL